MPKTREFPVFRISGPVWNMITIVLGMIAAGLQFVDGLGPDALVALLWRDHARPLRGLERSPLVKQHRDEILAGPEQRLEVRAHERAKFLARLELGCADPTRPCLIDNFLVSDPPLKQVVSHTYEAGLRGRLDLGEGHGRLNWSLGLFRTGNTDDIIGSVSYVTGASGGAGTGSACATAGAAI